MKLSSCAPELRYSSNSELSALKPLVLTFATLLATTSICRSSTICRDSPTRSVFSIVVLPFNDPRQTLPGHLRIRANRLGSPKPAVRPAPQRKPCQVEKCRCWNDLAVWRGGAWGGNKGLLTMFARQLFPSCKANESFRYPLL